MQLPCDSHHRVGSHTMTEGSGKPEKVVRIPKAGRPLPMARAIHERGVLS